MNTVRTYYVGTVHTALSEKQCTKNDIYTEKSDSEIVLISAD